MFSKINICILPPRTKTCLMDARVNTCGFLNTLSGDKAINDAWVMNDTYKNHDTHITLIIQMFQAYWKFEIHNPHYTFTSATDIAFVNHVWTYINYSLFWVVPASLHRCDAIVVCDFRIRTSQQKHFNCLNLRHGPPISNSWCKESKHTFRPQQQIWNRIE